MKQDNKNSIETELEQEQGSTSQIQQNIRRGKSSRPYLSKETKWNRSHTVDLLKLNVYTLVFYLR